MDRTYYEWLKKKNILLDNIENNEKRHNMEHVCVGRDIIDSNINTSLEQMRK
ncbi:hypothetical protein QBE52_07575 [Clostridiaceae bacterium 35-E11]